MQVIFSPSINIVNLKVGFKMMSVVNHKQSSFLFNNSVIATSKLKQLEKTVSEMRESLS
jgi:hypothetical protein